MLPRSLFLTTTLCLGLTKAEQASNFDLLPELMEEHGCDAHCQAAVAQANAADLQIFGTEFDFEFYSTAANFTASMPGDVLKLNLVDSSTINVEPGTTVFKMQYTSEDLDGSPVPATAFIAFPLAEAADPYKLVAIAHGTTGVFRGCAPSVSNAMPSYQGWETTGYAVVATDYTGLGNNYTNHKYLSNAAHANDVIYSVVAAKSAFPHRLTNEWVSFGHSQGGSAVWKLSEQKLVQDPRSGYLGGVAMAPAAPQTHEQIVSGLDMFRDSTDPAALSYLPAMIGVYLGAKVVFPDYDPTWLSNEAKKLFELPGLGQYCVTAMWSLLSTSSPDKLLASFDASRDSTSMEFQKINGVGLGSSASRPLLVAHGDKDVTVSVNSTIAAFKDACSHGNPVHLSIYPGQDHSGVVAESRPEWLRFIADRFDGAEFDNACAK
ncbi:unnamed protein product [Clonostachys rosea f. rosea IK726]|jgi:pimeloyl-ACP methyl ester carboxylesterase|uniref:Uncharacterized protein n=1 Tax=Clonostachys rosea f. rosea IK726 TaxID=1349383 RepID=A0ACA9TXX9_BIOOC|nr:unnamed protein product [Clonostachys rosea f. rosea IK726]